MCLIVWTGSDLPQLPEFLVQDMEGVSGFGSTLLVRAVWDDTCVRDNASHLAYLMSVLLIQEVKNLTRAMWKKEPLLPSYLPAGTWFS